MTASGQGRVNGARDGEDVAALFHCEARSDERAGIEGSLDHETTAGKTRDEAIAPGKISRVGRCAERKFGHQRTPQRDFPCEGLVAARIHDVDTGPQTRDGGSSSLQAAGVCGAVHADSQAAHDDQARLAERAREALRILQPLWRRVSASDHGERSGCQELYAAWDI